MTQDDAFLQAILEDPDDDTPRLVYADWLDEHGDADRAEFIRVQCELARLESQEIQDPQTQARVKALVVRQIALLETHRETWTWPLPKWARRRWCGFERGFVATVNISAELFLQRGAELFRAAPVRHLALDGVGDSGAALAESPLLLPLRSLLIVNQRLDDAAAQALAASPFLANLTLLNLDNNRITQSGAPALAASSHLKRLIRLQLGGNMLGEGGASALAEALSLPGLAVLYLSRNYIGNAGAAALAAASPLAGLNVLHLQSNWIGESGALAVARSPHLSDLQELHLRNNAINTRGLRALQTRFGSRVHL
jgi:uncharacterized protein (TIGR02996 family)